MRKLFILFLFVFSLKVTYQRLEATTCTGVPDPKGFSDCKGKEPAANKSGKCCFVKVKKNSENSLLNKCDVFYSENAGDMVSYLRNHTDYSGIDCGKGVFEIDPNTTTKYCSEKKQEDSEHLDEAMCYKTKRFYKYSKCFLATNKNNEVIPFKACVEASTETEAEEWAKEKYRADYSIKLYQVPCGEQLDPEKQADCETNKFKDPSLTKCCMAQYYADRPAGIKDNKCHAFEGENAYFVLKELREHYKANSSPEINYFDCGKGKVNVYNGVKRHYCSDRETDDDTITKNTCFAESFMLYTGTKCCYAKVNIPNSRINSTRCVEAKDKEEVLSFLKKLYNTANLNYTIECKSSSSYIYLGYLSLLLLILF